MSKHANQPEFETPINDTGRPVVVWIGMVARPNNQWDTFVRYTGEKNAMVESDFESRLGLGSALASLAGDMALRHTGVEGTPDEKRVIGYLTKSLTSYNNATPTEYIEDDEPNDTPHA